jgi:hypothetical protein
MPAAQPPQRVCPRCSTIARTIEPHCPFCGRSYTRRGPWAAVVAAVLATVAATLAGIALLLVAAGNAAETELERQVEVVERDFDRDVRRLERRILGEIDERLPAPPAPGTVPGE